MLPFRTVLYCVLPCLCAGVAAAADESLTNDRFQVKLGVYAMSSDTRLRLDELRGVGIGDTIELEDTFGFDDQNVFRLDASWRLAPVHKLRLMYFSSSRTATSSTQEELEFGDVAFPPGIPIKADFDFDIIELAYEYEFLHRDDYEIGVSFGIHNVEFRTKLDAGSTSGSLVEELDTRAPLPVLGLRALIRLGQSDFYAQAHAQYFSLSFDAYDGSVQDYQVSLMWQFSRHIGVGAGYNRFDTKLDIDDSDTKARIDWAYAGPTLYFTGTF
jgi:hypothetical protein